ncbi:MAG: DUF2752 domain-containing protein [Candidatus Aminicenantaceae bacterium]
MKNKWHHLVVVIICLFIIVGALVLTPPEIGSSQLKLLGIPLPQTCSFRNLTGIPCPGCGLSRSLVAALHEDLSNSFHYHRLGIITLLYVFLLFFHNLGMIVIPGFWNRTFGSGRILNKGIIVLAVLYFLNWIIVLL